MSKRIYENPPYSYELKTYWKDFHMVELKDNYCEIKDLHEIMRLAIIWCEDNCTDNFQAEWFRGQKSPTSIFELNPLFGFDYVYFGFKNKDDAIKFKMVWG